MKITVIIPAFNEEAYLASTLESIQSAAAYLRTRSDASVDIIVVDNNSDDGTAAVASGMGVTVVLEGEQGIARARKPARDADGEVLVFVDADVIVPPELLHEIHAAMSDPACVGGAVDVEYRPKRLSMRDLPARLAAPGASYGDGAGRDAVLPAGCLRGSRRL